MRSRSMVLLLVILGCGGGDPPPRSIAVPPPTAYPVPPADYLYSGNTAVIPEATQSEIRDEIALGRHWRTVTAGQSNPPPVPQIDFSRDIVVFVASGQRPQGSRVQVDSVGFELEATGPDITRRVMRVFGSTVSPCDPFRGGYSYPVQLARIQRADMPIRFTVADKPCVG